MSAPKRLWADVPTKERMSARDFRRCNGAYAQANLYGTPWAGGHKYWWQLLVARQASGCAAAVPFFGWPGKWNRCAHSVLSGETFCQTHGGLRKPPQTDPTRRRRKIQQHLNRSFRP